MARREVAAWACDAPLLVESRVGRSTRRDFVDWINRVSAYVAAHQCFQDDERVLRAVDEEIVFSIIQDMKDIYWVNFNAPIGWRATRLRISESVSVVVWNYRGCFIADAYGLVHAAEYEWLEMAMRKKESVAKMPALHTALLQALEAAWFAYEAGYRDAARRPADAGGAGRADGLMRQGRDGR